MAAKCCFTWRQPTNRIWRQGQLGARSSMRFGISTPESSTKRICIPKRSVFASRMSRAFVKEDVDLPERSGRKRSASGLPPGATNYITARGTKHLRDELQKLRAANTNSKRVAELEQILASIHVVDPPDAPSNSVAFGATVTVKDKKGRTETYTVVGVDELDLEA